MCDFDCPSIIQDLEVNNFHPAGAEEYRNWVLAIDALLFHLLIIAQFLFF
jgi:chromate reductase